MTAIYRSNESLKIGEYKNILKEPNVYTMKIYTIIHRITTAKVTFAPLPPLYQFYLKIRYLAYTTGDVS